MDRAHIPKVVASEMGSVQTYIMKSVATFLRECQHVAKGIGRCAVGVVSETR